MTDDRPPSFAEQLCRRLHPTRWQSWTFGACDGCKDYVLAVLESDWLAKRDADTEEQAVLEAADAIQALHPGEVKNSVIFLRQWAADRRKARIVPVKEGQSHS